MACGRVLRAGHEQSAFGRARSSGAFPAHLSAQRRTADLITGPPISAWDTVVARARHGCARDVVSRVPRSTHGVCLFLFAFGRSDEASLKAFVRADYIGKVVRALEDARAPGITVSVVRGAGFDFDPRTVDPRVFPLFSADELSRCPEVAKVEVVCSDEDVDRLLAAVVGAARTGGPGDGIVFITPVDRAVKVRTGEEGPQAFTRP